MHFFKLLTHVSNISKGFPFRLLACHQQYVQEQITRPTLYTLRQGKWSWTTFAFLFLPILLIRLRAVKLGPLYLASKGIIVWRGEVFETNDNFFAAGIAAGQNDLRAYFYILRRTYLQLFGPSVINLQATTFIVTLLVPYIFARFSLWCKWKQMGRLLRISFIPMCWPINGQLLTLVFILKSISRTSWQYTCLKCKLLRGVGWHQKMCIFLRILTTHVDNKDSCPSVFCLLLKHGLKNEIRGGGRERFAASKDAPAFGKYNKMHRSGAKEQKDSKIISFLWQKNSYHLLHFEFWVFTDLQLQDADSCIKNASWNPPTFFWFLLGHQPGEGMNGGRRIVFLCWNR